MVNATINYILIQTITDNYTACYKTCFLCTTVLFVNILLHILILTTFTVIISIYDRYEFKAMVYISYPKFFIV